MNKKELELIDKEISTYNEQELYAEAEAIEKLKYKLLKNMRWIKWEEFTTKKQNLYI